MTFGLNTFSNKNVTYEIGDLNNIEHQKNFLNWKPILSEVESYVCWILSLQFDRNNPNMKKVLNYFK